MLAPGDSAAGYRLPLTALPYLSEAEYPFIIPDAIPFAGRPPLPMRQTVMQTRPTMTPDGQIGVVNVETGERRIHPWNEPIPTRWFREPEPDPVPAATSGGGRSGDMSDHSRTSVRTAITIEPRGGKLCVFLPPVPDGRGVVRSDRRG